MSNIRSFDHRRRSLGELQRAVEQLQKEYGVIREWQSWQEAYLEHMEIELSQLRGEHSLLAESILSQLKAIHVMVMKHYDKLEEL